MNKTITHFSWTVFYRTEGDDRLPNLPVMLLHGFAEEGSIWDRQVDYLKKHYRLIIPDLPGSGQSSPIADTRSGDPPKEHLAGASPAKDLSGALSAGAASIEALMESVKAILDAEAIGQCVMIGHSMGGYIALAFAEKYPDRLAAFGLFHSSAYPDSESKKTTRKKSIEFIRRNGPPEFIRQSIPNLFSENYKQRHPGIVAALIERYSGFHPGSLIYYYNAMIARPDRTQVLREFHGPILFVIGDQDNAIPLADSLRQCHIPWLSYILILEDCGHQGMLEKTEPCNRMLDEFLQGIVAKFKRNP